MGETRQSTLSPMAMKLEYVAKLEELKPLREKQKPTSLRPNYWEIRQLAKGNYNNEYLFNDKYVTEGRLNPEVQRRLVRPSTPGGFHAMMRTFELYGKPTEERGIAPPSLPKWFLQRHPPPREMTPQDQKMEYLADLNASRPLRERVRPTQSRSDYYETRQLARGNYNNEDGYLFRDQYISDGRQY